MKRSFTFAAISLTVCFIFVSLTSVSAFAEPSAHEISSCTQLQDMPDIGGNDEAFVLTNDIDCTGVTFQPLIWEHVFIGSLDGQGHNIFNLTINEFASQYVGLFEATGGGSIENLNLIGGSVTGDSYVGALVGAASNTRFSHIYSTVAVSGVGDVGGLFGRLSADAESVQVDHLSTNSEVQGVWSAGGLAGTAASFYNGSSLEIAYSFSRGDVAGTHTDGNGVGGLIGVTTQGDPDDDLAQITIFDSYASGNVSAPDENNVGGLIGYTQLFGPSDGTGTISISRTYASGDVTGDQNVGGLIGNGGMINVPAQVITINDSFAVGQVQGNTAVAGLVGLAAGNNHDVASNNNFWDENSTGQSVCMTGAAASSCTEQTASGPDTPYYWDFSNAPFVGNWDNQGDPWFEHSDTYPTLTGDFDTDGASDVREETSPNDGDMDEDGTSDARQNNVASLGDFNEYVRCSTGYLGEVDVQPVATNDNWDFEFGVTSFLVFVSDGAQTECEIVIKTDMPASHYKLVKYFDDDNIHAIDDVTYSDVTIDGDHYVKSVYNAVDGGANDEDETENGIIVDPVALAVNLQPAAATTTTVVPAPQVAGELPATGNNTEPALMYAVVLLLIGSALTGRYHRKHRLLNRK